MIALLKQQFVVTATIPIGLGIECRRRFYVLLGHDVLHKDTEDMESGPPK